MIIYGWRAVHLKSAQPKTTVCPGCAAKGTMLISVFSKYAHVFWIPVFPLGKVGAYQCLECNFTPQQNDLPGDIKRDYDNLKIETNTPVWQISGLALLAILIGWGALSVSEEKKRELDYISGPLKGDIYEYKTESKQYSTLKLVEVTGDSVFFFVNKYETNMISEIHQIDKDTNYSEDQFMLSRSQLENMYDEGTIYDINRK